MARPFFAEVEPIRYVGPVGDRELGFRWYDADRVVAGRRMADHLRFAVCYWHSFCWPGSDVFGEGTFDRPWLAAGVDAIPAAEHKTDVAFEFFAKLGVPFFCFHDRDVAIVEAEERHTELGKEFECDIGLVLGRGDRIDACGQPRPIERALSEHVAPGPAERVPVADREAEMIGHAPPCDDAIGVVPTEAELPVADRSHVADRFDLGEERSGHRGLHSSSLERGGSAASGIDVRAHRYR